MTTFETLREQFSLGDAQVASLTRYVDLLLGWRRGNVTGVRTRAVALDTLVGDSLALLDVPALRVAGARWVDLGAGAGVPGIPLAVASPLARLTLLESVGGKCIFLEAAVEVAGLADRAHVVRARSEEFARRRTVTGAEDEGPHAAATVRRRGCSGGGREAFDVVLVRAVASLASVAELSAPLLSPNGIVLAVKSASAAARERSGGEAAARHCGLTLAAVVPLLRSPLAGSVCVVFEKHTPAPDWLPRRQGLATKRPLES